MDRFKLSFIFKSFIFVTIMFIIIAISIENFWNKFCIFFSLAITLIFTYEWNFIYERCEKVKFKIKKKVKEILLWAIFCEFSFMMWIMTLQIINDYISLPDEFCGVIAVIIWLAIYRLINFSSSTINELSKFSKYSKT